MTTAVQHRRGTTAEHAAFTGLEGEVTIDTTKDTAVIHDGTLTGGYPLAKENLANVTTSGLSSIDGASTASDDKFFIFDQSATSLKTITRAELNNAMEQDALANVSITGGTINGTTIGGTTAAGGSFTTLTTSGAVTHNSATANGVGYFNGSKVLTSGSALTFNGTNLDFGDGIIARFGAGSDLQIYHDGSNSRIVDAGTGNLLIQGDAEIVLESTAGDNYFRAVNGSYVRLYHNNATKLETTSTGIDVTGTVVSDGLQLDGGTANGVAYLNGSKVLTSGSALTFDGTNLGVGTIVPTSGAGVTIGNDAFSGATVKLSYTTGQSERGFISMNGGSAEMRIASGYAGYGGFTTFYTEGSEQMRLTSTGLGIGTSSPAGRLTLRGAAGTSGKNQGILLEYSNGTEYGAFGLNNGSGWPQIMARAGAGLTFHVNSDLLTTGEAMRLDSSGNLGIGTSSPSTPLDVQANSSALGIRVRGRASGDSSSVAFYSNNNATEQLSIFSSSSENAFFGTGSRPMTFSTNSAERMRLDASGNLGLGVTPSAWGSANKALDIFGYAGFSGNGDLLSTDTSNNTYIDSGGTTRYKASWFASLYRQRSGAHAWYTAPSGTAGNAISFTQAMTLTAGGSLGLGTTSPTAYGGVTLTLNDPTISAYFDLYWAGNRRGYHYATASTYNISTTTDIALVFETTGAERARIDSSGNLLVGTTTSNNRRFFASGGLAGSYMAEFANTLAGGNTQFGLTVTFSNASPNDSTSKFFRCIDSTLTRLEVFSNGGIANYQGNNVNLSDRREKTNFAPAKSYLETICAIPVQTFNYIDQNMEEDGGLTLGVVAQDVQAVAPELVMESNWGTEEEPKMRLSIYQTDLQYALMKAIQEQQAIIEDMKTRLAAAGI